MIIKGYVSTGYVRSKMEFEVEIEKEEWDEMTWVEQNKFMFDAACEQIEWGYVEEEE